MITNVLLVDDHPVFRNGLRLLLEDESDFRVVGEAGTGREAIKLTGQLNPDVVVMDISMPEMDGIQTTQAVLSEAPDTKVIALSIHSDKDFVEGMLLAGASGYILKESAPEEVVDGIRVVRGGKVFLSATITGIVVDEYRRALIQQTVLEESGRKPAIPILSTKLHRPAVTPDLVARERLLDRLEHNQQRPLTLISAQAGYGKSVLASMWLETISTSSAWLSLDEQDDDLYTFLSYLLFAFSSTFPSLELKTQALLEAPNLPPVSALGRGLLNDLGQLEQDFILVLDDIHRINKGTIFSLLTELLQHPPRNLHLVLVGRRDPPLPIASLRARGLVTEIRQKDLRFSKAETAQLLGNMLQREIEETTAAHWTQITEGWVTALKLAALSFRQTGQVDLQLAEFHGDSNYLREYITAEVLSHMNMDRQAWLLKTSLLTRFCAGLCEAVCVEEMESETKDLNGSEFIKWLRDTGLFVISLDTKGEWFRYHHLFQEILLDWMNRQFGSGVTADLHTRASRWFDENNLTDEALRHALAADDISFAVGLIEKHRNQLMNTEQWKRLESWLNKLPPGTIEKNPKLLITQAWLGLMYLSQYNKWLNTPDQIEQLLSGISIDSDEKKMIVSEIDALRTTLLYSKGEVDQTIDNAERVLRTLHPESISMIGQTRLVLAMAYQGKGNFDRSLKTIRDTMENYSFSSPVFSKMLMGLCVVNWLEGNISGINQPALQLLKLSAESNLQESTSFGRYFLGCFHYIRNEVSEAESHFAAVVENRYMAREHYHAQCAFGLALCFMAQGRDDQASQVVESLLENKMETDNTWLWQIARVFKAELALRLGQTVEAYNLAKTADRDFFAAMYVFYIPQLTAVKAMLAVNTSHRRKEAATLLEHLHDTAVSTHNNRLQIDVLAFHALLLDAQGDEPAAFEKLSQSLTLAEPGGFIRNYVDMGSNMARLLTHLSQQDLSKPYLAHILAAFPEEQFAASAVEPVSIRSGDRPLQPGLVEPLTKRELQTLKFLATDLYPSEIAAEMVVSESTVRAHTKNIYRKLDVHSRHEAVQRAKELDLI